MKRILKSTIAILTAGLIAFSSMSISVRAYEISENERLAEYINNLFIDYFGYEFMTNANRSTGYIDRFWDSLPQDRMGNVMWPNFFGGQYVNSDGNLVMNIVEDVMSIEEASYVLRDILGVDHNIILRPARFSFSELYRDAEIMRSRRFANNGNPAILAINENFSMSSIRADINRIKVVLVDISEEQIELFRTYILDSETVVFEQGGKMTYVHDLLTSSLEDDVATYYYFREYYGNYIGIEPHFSFLNPGSRINTRNFDCGITLGFRARNANGQLGFITTGHDPLARPGDTIFGQFGLPVGTVTSLAYNRSLGLDAAFVLIEYNVSINNNVPGFGNLSNAIPRHAEMGEPVAMFGASTWDGVGLVTNPQGSVGTWANLIFTDITTTAGGDSGSVLFTNNANRLVLGVHSIGRLALDGSGERIGTGASLAIRFLPMLRAFVY
jgi:hypothetical protein